MQKKGFDYKGAVGDIKPVMGSSMALNNQRNVGAEKPSAMGNHSPGGTRPERVNESPMPIPMPK